MAINKVVNRKSSSHGALRNVISYILRNDKIKEGYVEITGPYAGETINHDDIYQTWLEEKRIWNKDSGRMYAHNIISFHKDENITPQEVFEIGKRFADNFFSDHQCLIGVHLDKNHLHCHILTNSVSYIDGLKLHQTKHDLQRQKDFTNRLCLERGLTIAEKGKHFDGSEMEMGEITAWSKDKYHLLTNEVKKSFVADCAIALIESVPLSSNKDEFISNMAARGWSVQWKDKRKHIIFMNENGDKVRDSNISKTFSMDINKEALNHEFERQNAERIRNRKSDEAELERYYAELDSAISGTGSFGETIENNSRTGRTASTESADDFRAYISKLDSKEKNRRDAVESAITDSQDERRTVSRKEGQSIATAEQRRVAEQKRSLEQEAARRSAKSLSHSRGFER